MRDAILNQLQRLRRDPALFKVDVHAKLSRGLGLLETDQLGEALYVLCTGCHGMSGRRESHHLGPSLVDIVDRPIASARGFEYSHALRNLAGGDATWTHDQLDAFLKAPKHMAPGTKMEFAGLLQADDRAALIGYLEKL